MSTLARKKMSRGSIKTSHGDEVCLMGRFRFNGSSAPTSLVGNWISSVAHTGTGIWTVTMKPSFRKLYGAYARQVTLEADAAATIAAAALTIGAYDTAAGTFIVRNHTSGSLADIAAGSNLGNWCHMTLWLKASHKRDGSGL
jgi:hypothetical protein